MFRVFYSSIGQTGMQQATFGDTDLLLRQIFEYGRNTTEIEVFLFINQMHMDNFSHNYIAFI